VFVELEPGLEGLLHISELTDHRIDGPEDVVKVGDEIECKVLRVDVDDRKIGLSRKSVGREMSEAELKQAADELAAKERASHRELKGGIGSSNKPLFDTGR
jgi:small subunit ribosomal protein S1